MLFRSCWILVLSITITNMVSVNAFNQHLKRMYSSNLNRMAARTNIRFRSSVSSSLSFSALQNKTPIERGTNVRNARLFQSSAHRQSTSTQIQMSIKDTPLGEEKGSLLLDGLDVYSIPASGDSHPLTVYGIESKDISPEEGKHPRKPVLLLHGRTWSAVPVYHLAGGSRSDHSSLSFMESLLAVGLQPYAVDFRGFGGTPAHDSSYSVEPNRCVEDAETALDWIAKRHGLEEQHSDNETNGVDMPALFGWSQGALIAQLLAQKSPHLISKLVLYGSIYDPMLRYARAPLFVNTTNNTDANSHEHLIYNDYGSAIEDFTIEGSIAPEQARLFAEAALTADPIKARWVKLNQFNNCDPARVHVPTLVVCI